MSRLATRLQKAERMRVLDGCPDEFHASWCVLYEDEGTGELPPRPHCPTCGREAERVIKVVYEDTWPPEGSR